MERNSRPKKKRRKKKQQRLHAVLPMVFDNADRSCLLFSFSQLCIPVPVPAPWHVRRKTTLAMNAWKMLCVPRSQMMAPPA